MKHRCLARIPASLQEVSLSCRFRRSLYAALFALLAELSPAQNQSPVALDTSETLFTVLTAINTCGYDQELASPIPCGHACAPRSPRPARATQEAKDATQAMCKFYEEHQQPEASRTLAQYTSLALY